MKPPLKKIRGQQEFPWTFPIVRAAPVHVAKVGNVRVPIYAYRDGRFCVAWRAFARGPLKRETFPTRAAAIRRAEELATALANSQADVVTLTSADRDHYRLAVQSLAPLGIPLHAAIAEYVAARGLIAGHTVIEAAQSFARSTLQNAAQPATREIVDAILADMRGNARNPRTPGYLRTIAPRLLAIAAAFPTLADCTAESVPKFLQGLRHKGRLVSPKTYNHYRATFALLWQRARTLAETRRFTLGPDPLARVERLHAPGSREVLTIPELRALLDYTPHEWLPLVVLGAFAGLRVCEVARLSWSDCYWDHAEIRLSDGVAGKRGSPRNVPMCDALRAWLAPWRTAIGRIYDEPERALERRSEWFHQQCRRDIPGFRWKPNALRHSFGSYHVGKFQNLELTRTIMGTGFGMLRNHYHSSQFRADADAYWSLMPSSSEEGKIVALA